MPTNPPECEPLTTAEVLGWTEFGCWSAFAIAPILYWLQGPAVSQEQLVVRTALVVIAATAAIGLRVAALRRARVGESPTEESSASAPDKTRSSPK